jgi:hypothetical protein
MTRLNISSWIVSIFFALFSSHIQAQTQPENVSLAKSVTWTETDRKYLLDNLSRSKQEIINETKNLSEKQWNFKESPDRWSINEVVEHIAIWELLFMHDISRSLGSEPNPENAKVKPDSNFVNFIMEATPHHSLEYTKPFSYTIPMGINNGKNNLAWLLKMRDESLAYLKTETKNIRNYYNRGNSNVHQLYIYVFGHTDRHLRQLKKIKQHPKYPK